MNKVVNDDIYQWLEELSVSLAADSDAAAARRAISFLHDSTLPMQLIDVLAALPEENTDHPIYAACLYAMELGISELQMVYENGHKQAHKILDNMMSYLADVMTYHQHTSHYWLPILNAFYDARVELLPQLKEAYLDAAEFNAIEAPVDEQEVLENIRALINELAGFSDYDIAEHFFVQSYAMPPEFMASLVMDLYQIEEGKEIALLSLLHPKAEMREMVIDVMDEVFMEHTLSSLSLTRLQAIKHWYPAAYHSTFDRWIKDQRKRGVVFLPETAPNARIISIKASEIDGTGAQGFYIHLRTQRKSRLCGMLVKDEVGIKDVWLTQLISMREAKQFDQQSQDEDDISLRVVDESYFQLMMAHFLAVSLQQNHMPDLHLFEIQEQMGTQFKPDLLNIEAMIKALCVQISPFTPELIQRSLIRSENWIMTQNFAHSWYLEHADIDKIVNQHCTIVDGTKICNMPDAINGLFDNELEKLRAHWMFHFLRMSLWFGKATKKDEKYSLDCLLIAHAILEGMPLKEIPIFQSICRQTVLNSLETMHERKTYLSI